MVHHDFTNTIISETEKMLRLDGKEILQASPLMEYKHKDKICQSGFKSPWQLCKSLCNICFGRGLY